MSESERAQYEMLHWSSDELRQLYIFKLGIYMTVHVNIVYTYK